MSAIYQRRHESDLHFVLRTSARFISIVLISAAVMFTIGGLSGLWMAGGV